MSPRLPGAGWDIRTRKFPFSEFVLVRQLVGQSSVVIGTTSVCWCIALSDGKVVADFPPSDRGRGGRSWPHRVVGGHLVLR